MALDSILQVVGDRAQRILDRAGSASSWATLAGMGAVLLLELVVMGYGASSLRRLLHPTRSTLADMFYFAARVLGYYNLVTLVFSLGLPALATRLSELYFGWDVLSRIQHPVLHAVLFVVATDFVGYWTHRARHAFRWWWELHKYHHAATEFNAITTARRHPLDGAAMVLISCIPTAMLGGSIDQYIVLSMVLTAHSGLTHSMLGWKWGWFGKYVLFSPVGHRVHHSPLAIHMDCNFGGLFPIWDWLFGTLYTGDVVNGQVGVDNDYYAGHGVLSSIAVGTRRAARVALARKPRVAVTAVAATRREEVGGVAAQ
jgi:sterol desaturase/sphingolipid hydroxylase (fatty acid hydroxylase superfamily)